MTVGSLRDQVIYPHLRDEMVGRGVKDAQLLDILKKVWGGEMVWNEFFVMGDWTMVGSVVGWNELFNGGFKKRWNLWWDVSDLFGTKSIRICFVDTIIGMMMITSMAIIIIICIK